MIGVIADDLTGAAELGGIGIRGGLTAEVIIHGRGNRKADLVCVDTDSRSCAAEEAAQRAATAATDLRKAGARWIYKKVDSVLRGNVLAEIHAIQKTLGLQGTLLIPANPSLGRQIRLGRYYINGKPIHLTDFARDPEHPRTSSNVFNLLKAKNAYRVTVNRLAEYLPGSGIILGEVSTSSDVQEWALQRDKSMLMAGGAEFFGAMLRYVGPVLEVGAYSSPIRRETDSGTLRELFVCGSTSNLTAQFVSETGKRGVPVFNCRPPGGSRLSVRWVTVQSVARQVIFEFRSHQRLVLNIGRPFIEKRAVARKLAGHLAEIAALVIADAKPDHVYAEGGATAAALVRQLGWSRMKVLEERAPGVITLTLPGRSKPLLTIKPGSYPGWPKLSR
jgi:uncharacterized protein YgbK (DUF1537 family)